MTVEELWETLEDIPMNPETECIEESWLHFKKGTFREDIWHWFEETFNVSVAKLLYGDEYEDEFEEDITDISAEDLREWCNSAAGIDNN